MLEDKIREVILTPKRVSSMVFSHNNVRYRANVSSSRIVLSKNASKDGTPVAEYDLKTGKDSWYLDHNCHNKYFKENASICHACETPESKLEATPENIEILATNSKYTPELSEILCHEVIKYVKKYELCLKNV